MLLSAFLRKLNCNFGVRVLKSLDVYIYCTCCTYVLLLFGSCFRMCRCCSYSCYCCRSCMISLLCSGSPLQYNRPREVADGYLIQCRPKLRCQQKCVALHLGIVKYTILSQKHLIFVSFVSLTSHSYLKSAVGVVQKTMQYELVIVSLICRVCI